MSISLTREQFMERFKERCSSMGPPIGPLRGMRSEIQPGATPGNTNIDAAFNQLLTEFFHTSLGAVLDRVYTESW